MLIPESGNRNHTAQICQQDIGGAYHWRIRLAILGATGVPPCPSSDTKRIPKGIDEAHLQSLNMFNRIKIVYYIIKGAEKERERENYLEHLQSLSVTQITV